jgi:hypothetical protein
MTRHIFAALIPPPPASAAMATHIITGRLAAVSFVRRL